MTEYELTNGQRANFGLSSIESHWDKIFLDGDTYRQKHFYYEVNAIK